MMLRLMWRGWACWREWKWEWGMNNAYGYKGCLGMGPLCLDVWRR